MDMDDTVVKYTLLGFIVVVVGWLVYKHTGQEPGQIEAVYWAGVATPLLSQLVKKAFDLVRKEK